MLKDPDQIDPTSRAKFDDLLDDVFGLNIRGLHTIATLIKSPSRLFASAHAPNWEGQFTPTVRLAFSLITVFTLLSFFWAAEDGPFFQSLQTRVAESGIVTPDGPSAADITSSYFAAYSFVYPFAYILVHGMVASCVFFWGRGTPWVVRIRLYFALLSSALILAILSIMMVPLVDPENLIAYTTFGLGSTFLIYWITYVRGMRHPLSQFSTWMKATLLGAIMMTGDLLVAVMTSVASSYWSDVLFS